MQLVEDWAARPPNLEDQTTTLRVSMALVEGGLLKKVGASRPPVGDPTQGVQWRRHVEGFPVGREIEPK